MNLLGLLNWAVASAAIIITAYLLPGVAISGVGSALIAALVLGFINAIIRPVLILLTLPVTILSFGLFVFVLNALLVMLAGAIVPGFYVASFWWALLFSLIVSLVRTILHRIVDKQKNS